MKKIVALLIIVILGIVHNTVAQTEKCEAIFDKYTDEVKSRVYEGAKETLKVLQKECPKYDAKIYTYAEDIYNYEIESSRTDENRTAYIDTLLTLYNKYEKHFPGNGSVVRKALLQKKHDLANDDKVYETLNTFFTVHKDKFVDYDALQTYFMLYLDRYKSGEKNISQKDFVSKYADIAGQVAFAKDYTLQQERTLLKLRKTQELTEAEKQILAETNTTINALEAVADNIRILASKHFSCDILSAYYSDDFDKNKSNTQWLSAVTDVMYSNKCYDNEVLYKAAKALYKLNPGVQIMQKLGTIELRRNNTKDAIAYFEKAAEMETGTMRKAEQYYNIASIFRNIDKAKAKQYAQKAIDTHKSYGKPYLFLAEMYSSVTGECGLNDFERKALLFKSLEMINEAEIAEPRYKTTVAVLKERYSKNLPEKPDAKAAGYKRGDKITYNCWINETLKLPKM